MKPKRSIHIPEPCHEDWNEMTPKEKGRFCQACDKVVVDFRKKTKSEILDIIDKAAGNTCGRFYSHQLDSVEGRKTMLPKLSLAASMAGLAFMAPQVAQAQGEPYVQSNHQYNWEDTQTYIDKDIKKPKIRGKIVYDNVPMQARIVLSQNGKKLKETTSDKDGSYTFKVPRKAKHNQPLELTAYPEGHPEHEISYISITQEVTTIDIMLNQVVDFMGQAIAPIVCDEKKDYKVKVDSLNLTVAPFSMDDVLGMETTTGPAVITEWMGIWRSDDPIKPFTLVIEDFDTSLFKVKEEMDSLQPDELMAVEETFHPNIPISLGTVAVTGNVATPEPKSYLEEGEAEVEVHDQYNSEIELPDEDSHNNIPFPEKDQPIITGKENSFAIKHDGPTGKVYPNPATEFCMVETTEKWTVSGSIIRP